MDNKAVDKLFIVLMCFIILISIYNAYNYFSPARLPPQATGDYVFAWLGK